MVDQTIDSDLVLEENAIGAMWHICLIANSFVFPIYAEFEKNYGITRMEFVVLFVLSQRDQLMAWQICRMTGLPKNNISRGVKKLLEKDLINRVQDPMDARRAYLSVSPLGRKLYEELIKPYAARAKSAFSLLDDKDKSDLERILLKVSRGLPAFN